MEVGNDAVGSDDTIVDGVVVGSCSADDGTIVGCVVVGRSSAVDGAMEVE